MPRYDTASHIQELNSLWKEKKQEQCKQYFNSLSQDQKTEIIGSRSLGRIRDLHCALVSIYDKEIIYDLAAEYMLEQSEGENDYNILYDIVNDLVNYLEETETDTDKDRIIKIYNYIFYIIANANPTLDKDGPLKFARSNDINLQEISSTDEDFSKITKRVFAKLSQKEDQ